MVRTLNALIIIDIIVLYYMCMSENTNSRLHARYLIGYLNKGNTNRRLRFKDTLLYNGHELPRRKNNIENVSVKLIPRPTYTRTLARVRT